MDYQIKPLVSHFTLITISGYRCVLYFTLNKIKINCLFVLRPRPRHTFLIKFILLPVNGFHLRNSSANTICFLLCQSAHPTATRKLACRLCIPINKLSKKLVPWFVTVVNCHIGCARYVVIVFHSGWLHATLHLVGNFTFNIVKNVLLRSVSYCG